MSDDEYLPGLSVRMDKVIHDFSDQGQTVGKENLVFSECARYVSFKKEAWDRIFEYLKSGRNE